MDESTRKKPKPYPDFDVLSENADEVANKVKSELESFGIENVTLFQVDALGEIIPAHIEIRVNDDTIASVYTPVACHNYNQITIDNKEIRIATMDTLLSFYLAFLFSDEFNEFQDRILCMATYLFKIFELNRTNQTGILKRFSMECIGEQRTLRDMLELKNKKFDELKQKRNSEEYNKWFFKYNPNLVHNSRTNTTVNNDIDIQTKTKKHKDKHQRNGIFSFIKWREDDDSSSSSSSSSSDEDHDEDDVEVKEHMSSTPYRGEGLLDSFFWPKHTGGKTNGNRTRGGKTKKTKNGKRTLYKTKYSHK